MPKFKLCKGKFYSNKAKTPSLACVCKLLFRSSAASFWLFRAVFGARDRSFGNARCIKRTTHYVILHTGQILDTTATHQHNAVFLQVVSLAAYVANDLKSTCQADFGNFSQSRIRLFGGCRINTGANAPSLRTIFQRRGFGLRQNLFALFTNQLIYRRHGFPFIF